MKYQERLYILVETLADGKCRTSAELGAIAGLSERSIHRSIRTLRDQGYRIDGERGIGFMMRPRPDGGYTTLPKLPEEVDGRGDAHQPG